jgi:hypothetical protein
LDKQLEQYCSSTSGGISAAVQLTKIGRWGAGCIKMRNGLVLGFPSDTRAQVTLLLYSPDVTRIETGYPRPYPPFHLLFPATTSSLYIPQYLTSKGWLRYYSSQLFMELPTLSQCCFDIPMKYSSLTGVLGILPLKHMAFANLLTETQSNISFTEVC